MTSSVEVSGEKKINKVPVIGLEAIFWNEVFVDKSSASDCANKESFFSAGSSSLIRPGSSESKVTEEFNYKAPKNVQKPQSKKVIYFTLIVTLTI